MQTGRKTQFANYIVMKYVDCSKLFPYYTKKNAARSVCWTDKAEQLQ